MVGAFREPSCGRRTQPIHSIPYSVAQPLERGFKNYYSIIQGKCREFINATWENYQENFSVVGIEKETKEALTKIVLYNVIHRRITIDKVKQGVNL